MSTTRIEVFSGDAPENALELAAWLQAKLAEVPEALRYLEEGHARGKVVIAVD